MYTVCIHTDSEITVNTLETATSSVANSTFSRKRETTKKRKKCGFWRKIVNFIKSGNCKQTQQRNNRLLNCTREGFFLKLIAVKSRKKKHKEKKKMRKMKKTKKKRHKMKKKWKKNGKNVGKRKQRQTFDTNSVTYLLLMIEA